MGNEPPRIFFLHIPKTAGLTLRELIWRQYRRPEKFIPAASRNAVHAQREAHIRYLMEGGEPPGWGRHRIDPQVERLASLPPERVRQIRIVLGHLWFGVHEVLPGPFTYITMLRDPVDRVLSAYHHRATRHGLRMSVEDYIRSERDTRMDNGQTRRLVTATREVAREGEITPALFDSAVRNLREHFTAVGLTERFDLSVLAMARSFGWRKLGYVSYNVSRRRPRAEDLPADVLAILRRHNEYDFELVKIARELLDRRADELGIDPEADVAAFRRRLAIYQKVRPPYDAIRREIASLRGTRAPREHTLRAGRRV